MKIQLSKPSITNNEINAVAEVMKTGNIAMGSRVLEFEHEFAKYCRTKYAIAVSSGTAALFLVLKALKIGRGMKVITTPFSFVASTNVIYQAGAEPFYVDIREDTYNLDVHNLIDSIGITNIGGILPVDVFGNPFNSNKVQGIPCILDACESLGSEMARPFDAAVYAFYPNKQITCGEGGMIVTNNKSVYEFCVAMRNQGRKNVDSWLTSSYMGLNFRMTDMQAAIGIEQLKRIDEILEKRLNAYHKYVQKFNEIGIIDNIKLQKWEENCKVSPFVFTVEVENRDRIMLWLRKKGIETKPYFPCIHLQPYMRQKGYTAGMYTVAEEVSRRILALPYFTEITEEEIKYVVENLKEAMISV